VNLLLNVESLSSPHSGIGRYTEELLKGLQARADVEKLLCFSNHRFIDPDVVFNLVSGEEKGVRTNSVMLGLKNKLRSVPYLYDLLSTMRGVAFRYRACAYKDAVYHEPNYILKPFDGPSVATIHDLSFMHCPEFHPLERVNFLEKNLVLTLNRADHLITDSVFIRNELIDMMGVSPEKITAISLGVDLRFHPRKDDQLIPVLSNFNLLPRQYILSVATIEPRKNLDRVIDAYLQLDSSLRKKFPLILVGGSGWQNEKLMARINSLELKGELKYIGAVSSKDLPFLFAGAKGFVFVPVYEGFGLPALEALASGVPLVASNVSSLPEVIGDAGILVDYENIDEIKYAIEKILIDSVWCDSESLRGIERAKNFTWGRCVDETVSVYRKVQL